MIHSVLSATVLGVGLLSSIADVRADDTARLASFINNNTFKLKVAHYSRYGGRSDAFAFCLDDLLRFSDGKVIISCPGTASVVATYEIRQRSSIERVIILSKDDKIATFEIAISKSNPLRIDEIPNSASDIAPRRFYEKIN